MSSSRQQHHWTVSDLLEGLLQAWLLHQRGRHLHHLRPLSPWLLSNGDLRGEPQQGGSGSRRRSQHGCSEAARPAGGHGGWQRLLLLLLLLLLEPPQLHVHVGGPLPGRQRHRRLLRRWCSQPGRQKERQRPQPLPLICGCRWQRLLLPHLVVVLLLPGVPIGVLG